MRLFLFFIGLLGVFASAPVSARGGTDQGPAIRVLEGDWGNADIAEIETLLHAVASELWRFFPERSPSKLVVIASKDGPFTFYQRGPNGEYVILLSARNSRWAQYVYQFSHEVCHVLSNHDRHAKPNQWFEEAMCEAAALFTLRSMASTWESNPSFLDWKDYASNLRVYAERLFREPHRTLPHETSIGTWYAANQQAVRENPYLRDKNEVCANLLLPLFERNPEHWAAIGYLNLDQKAVTASFMEYLESWRSAVPAKHRQFISEVIALFKMPEPMQMVSVK
jgi:hypothetical protein